MAYVRLLRNIIRCLPLPCIFSSTNPNVNNMPLLKSDLSQSDANVCFNLICNLYKPNLTAIMNRIDFSDLNKKLFDYVDPSVGMKLLVNESNQIILLIDLKIECDELNKEQLLKFWDMLVKQSETCLQGTSYFVFTNFIDLLTEYHDKNLNMERLWLELCRNMYNKFCMRKSTSMNLGKFFSLRMFSTNTNFFLGVARNGYDENDFEITEENETAIKDSITYHFYFFFLETATHQKLFHLVILRILYY